MAQTVEPPSDGWDVTAAVEASVRESAAMVRWPQSEVQGAGVSSQEAAQASGPREGVEARPSSVGVEPEEDPQNSSRGSSGRDLPIEFQLERTQPALRLPLRRQ